MCYSFEVSLLGGILTYILGFIILQRKLNVKERQYVYFLFIFSSIQFADALLWYSGMKKNNLNYYTTSILIPLILSIQVLFNFYIINKFKNPLIIIFSILLTIYFFYYFNGYSKPFCRNNLSSPIWGGSDISILGAFIFAIMIFYPNWKIILYSIIIITLIKIIIKGSIGSWWCFISIFFSVIYYFVFGTKYVNIIM